MRDAAHLTAMLFHWWQSVLVLQEGSASPSSSAPCNACPKAAVLHPNRSSTSLIYCAPCLFTRAGNWNIFSHLRCHHDFLNPIFRVTHIFLRHLTSKLGRPSNPLSALYISLELLCPTASHKNLMKTTKCSTNQAVVLCTAVTPG